jgi:hypothetical protein
LRQARRERQNTKYQTDLEYREKILAKNRRNAAKLEQTLKRQATTKRILLHWWWQRKSNLAKIKKEYSYWKKLWLLWNAKS